MFRSAVAIVVIELILQLSWRVSSDQLRGQPKPGDGTYKNMAGAALPALTSLFAGITSNPYGMGTTNVLQRTPGQPPSRVPTVLPQQGQPVMMPPPQGQLAMMPQQGPRMMMQPQQAPGMILAAAGQPQQLAPGQLVPMMAQPLPGGVVGAPGQQVPMVAGAGIMPGAQEAAAAKRAGGSNRGVSGPPTIAVSLFLVLCSLLHY